MKVITLTSLFVIGLSVMVSAQTKEEFSQTKPKPHVVVKKRVVSPVNLQKKNTIDIHSEEYRQKNNIPDDFPRYINTGNEKQDEELYFNAKQEWIKNNPERFEKIKHLAL